MSSKLLIVEVVKFASQASFFLKNNSYFWAEKRRISDMNRFATRSTFLFSEKPTWPQYNRFMHGPIPEGQDVVHHSHSERVGKKK